MEVKQSITTYWTTDVLKEFLRKGISVSQKLPEISKPGCWMWKDGRIGKAEKKMRWEEEQNYDYEGTEE